MHEAAFGDTQPRIERRCGEKYPQSRDPRTFDSITDVIVIDETDNREAASTASAPEIPAGVYDCHNCPAPQESMFCRKGNRIATRNTPRDESHHGEWNILYFVQLRERTRLLWSSFACVHVFFNEEAMLHVEGRQLDTYKQ